MKQEFILLGIVFAALVFLIWRISYHEKRRNRRLLQQIRGPTGRFRSGNMRPETLIPSRSITGTL